MVEIGEDVREKVRGLLRELFQFDAQDLDFGIYRIMNFRRKEIEKFIEQGLIAEAERQFQEYSRVGQEELKSEVEKLRNEILRDFGEGTLDSEGNVKKNEDAPKVRLYLDRRRQLQEAVVSQSQISDVFNHIYEFFSRYYDKGDFISKRRYGGRDKYYIPYNGEEVVLHWANKDQYYVKTAEFFRNYHFKVGGYRVNFLLREAEVEVNNVVGENKYFVLCASDFVEIDDAKKVVDIYFEWRALTDEEERKFGKRNVQDLLVVDAVDRIFSETSGSNVGNLLRVKETGDKTVLEKHLNNYVRRNTTDYFIHKNLKAFLERELEFYIKNEVVDLDELENLDERSLRIARAKVKAIREISRKIIEFLAQIEDFQKMLFEKKKFIIGTEYVITLDKIKEYAGEEFLESIADEILKNTRQLEEWKEVLGMEIKNKKDLVERQTFDGKEWKKLPLDTRYFGIDFKIRLLEALSERHGLDEILDGILIKSENWQALNLLLGKFEGKVQSIYIDPPFNTGTNEFLYKNNYLNSTWLTMLLDRLIEGKLFLNGKGNFFLRIDHHGDFYVRQLLNSVFGENTFQNQIVLKRGRETAGTRGKLEIASEALFWFSRTTEPQFYEIVIPRPISQVQWTAFLMGGERHPRERIFLGKTLIPPDGQHFALAQAKVDKLLEEHFLRLRCRKCGAIYFKADSDERLQKQMKQKENRYKFYDITPQKVVHGVRVIDRCLECDGDEWTVDYLGAPTENVSNLWIDIESYSRSIGFFTENSEILLKRVIELSSTKGEWVLDYFLGSGTTTAVAQKLCRKWIGVEMGEYFDTIPLRRMKAVLAGEQSGISKEVGWQGSGFFKYHYIEQYEDTLNNIVFREKDKTVQETLDEFGDYLLKNMLEFETRGSPTRLNVEQFQMPFDYKIWVTTAGEKTLATVDLVETFNYLLGVTVEKFCSFKDQEREYRCIFGKLNQENIAIIWRNTKDIDLKKDKEFIENTILAGTKPDRIFINGDSLVEKAEPIEPTFKRLMGA